MVPHSSREIFLQGDRIVSPSIRQVRFNMKNLRTLVVIASLLVVLTGAQLALGADDGKFTVLNCWEKGTYTLLQECTNTVITTVGKTEAERNESRLLFNWQIEASSEGEDGVQQFKMKLLRVMMRMRVNGRETIYFDSSNGRAKVESLNAVFRNMKNTSVTVVFKNGTPTEVLGCDDFWKDISEPTEKEEKDLLLNVRGLASSDNIRQTFETLVYLDSAEEVAVGDKWKNSTTLALPSIGDKTLEWNCSLDSVEDSKEAPLATVSGKGSLDFAVKEPTKGVVRVEMENTVTYNTRYYFPTTVDSKVYVVHKSEEDADSAKAVETRVGFSKNKLTVVKH